MRVVIQRVTDAQVLVNDTIKGQINTGILLLLGFEEADDLNDIKWMASKIVNLRIFDDEKGVMNLSVNDIGGGILVVSQFTLHALTKKGNRPSYIKAAPPAQARSLYNTFVEHLENLTEHKVETGDFGAMMAVKLTNSGPVTILIDTKNKA